jgi:hypothetical protein
MVLKTLVGRVPRKSLQQIGKYNRYSYLNLILQDRSSKVGKGPPILQPNNANRRNQP